MKINCVLKLSERAYADALILPYLQKEKGDVFPAFIEKSFSKWTSDPLKLKDFEGRLGEIFLVYPKSAKEKRIIMLGLGEELSTESLRRAYAKLTSYCHAHLIKKINLLVPKISKFPEDALIQGISEGLFLTNYVFENLKGASSKKTSLLTHASFLSLSTQKKKKIDKWKSLSEGVCLARDLVNDNADAINAKTLEKVAKKLEKDFTKIKTVILDKKKLEKENLKLMLAVNRGARVDPSLIILNYQGNPGEKEAATIVGKGITYDTGGIQLKPSNGSIINMKCDMSGAAAVLGTLYAAAKLDLALNLVGIIPACENAIGPESYKPGDVYESYLGKTVEIISTDAEGRLVLADALAYAQDHFQSEHLIDLATLTGGVVAALGNKLTGLMTNNPQMARKIMVASEKSGENIWELPLYSEYKECLKSSVADLQNTSRTPGYPSAIVAGLFLQEFVKNTSWAHLDIAGTAYLSDPKYYHKTKATGVGVRLVIAFLEELLES